MLSLVYISLFSVKPLTRYSQAQDSDMPTSATNTPSHAPTPASSVPPQLASRDSNHATPSSTVSKANSKKKKAADKDDDDDKPAKRLKITYGRE
jgi:chromatin modification-related protein EAF6